MCIYLLNLDKKFKTLNHNKTNGYNEGGIYICFQANRCYVPTLYLYATIEYKLVRIHTIISTILLIILLFK